MSKKILQIKKGEYLLDILHSGAVRSTYNKDVALDISQFSLKDVGYLVENFKKIGYIGVEILTIEEPVKEEEVELDGEK